MMPQYGQSNFAAGYLGRPLGGNLPRTTFTARRDTVGWTSQVDDINVGGDEDSDEYSIRFTPTTPGRSANDAVTASYTTDASATVAEIIAGLIAAMYASPSMMQYIHSIVADTAKFTVTLKAGQSGTWSYPENPTTDLTTTSVTVAADFQTYTFGRVVEVVAAPSAGVDQGIRPLVARARGARLTVNVPTPDDTETSTTTFLYTPAGGTGEIRTLVFTSTAVENTSLDAMVIAAATALPEATATDNGTDATLDFPPGDTIEIISIVNTATLVVTITDVPGDALPQCTFVADDGTTAAVDGYPVSTPPTTIAGKPIPTFDGGPLPFCVALPSGQSPSFNGLVYAETAAGANKGLCYASPGLTKIPVLVGPARVPTRWVRTDPGDSTLAHVQVGA